MNTFLNSDFNDFNIFWFTFAIANLLQLLMLKSVDWMIPHGWRCPPLASSTLISQNPSVSKSN